ncbi:MAG TPA: hypothetical protein VI548_13485 [Chitinophagaceae bacterium]|nr:hypothetical protein [Chitinophagaceae bacterium]
MKPQTNKLPLRKISKTEMIQPSAPGLSDEAFYLIALANLLKKEFGKNLPDQYLVPVEIPVYKGRAGR